MDVVRANLAVFSFCMSLHLTCKMCRREGVSLCGREKCAVKRRPFPPGQHGPTARGTGKMSGYGKQLREKQKAKRLYGVMERQFRQYFEAARRKKGNTGDVLMQLLETRLDNVVYRLGIGKTRAQARQLVSHGLIFVNDGLVDIPSFHVRIGDAIRVRDTKKSKGVFAELPDRLKNHEAPGWLNVDQAVLGGKVTALPEGKDLQAVFDPTLIVELYSR